MDFLVQWDSEERKDRGDDQDHPDQKDHVEMPEPLDQPDPQPSAEERKDLILKQLVLEVSQVWVFPDQTESSTI
jgi:hypothetical protein